MRTMEENEEYMEDVLPTLVPGEVARDLAIYGRNIIEKLYDDMLPGHFCWGNMYDDILLEPLARIYEGYNWAERSIVGGNFDMAVDDFLDHLYLDLTAHDCPWPKVHIKELIGELRHPRDIYPDDDGGGLPLAA